MRTDLNPNLKDAPIELKTFIESFYREEGKKYLENDANLFDLDADLADIIEDHKPDKMFKEIVLAMKKYKSDILQEILDDLNKAEHDTIYSKEYVAGCEHTINRVIVHIQQKILGNV